MGGIGWRGSMVVISRRVSWLGFAMSRRAGAWWFRSTSGSGRRWPWSPSHHGEVVRAPFEFQLDEPGVRWLLSSIAEAERTVHAVVCRVGVESSQRAPR